MDRRESLAEGDSFSNNDMHDFSVSSIISNISRLLEGKWLYINIYDVVVLITVLILVQLFIANLSAFL
jgi:hypothetical protein